MERWDLFDKDLKPLGKTMGRDEWPMSPGEYHVQVLGLIQRPDGRYLITQRKHDKQWAPGLWEFAGGAVRAGEDFEDATRREVTEETGVDVFAAPAEKVLEYRREDPKGDHNYFMVIYKFILDVDESMVNVQEEEVEGFAFASVDEIAALAAKGEFLHYDSIKEVL